MNAFTDWGSILSASFVELWYKFINILPNLVGALIVLVAGLLLANAAGRILARALKAAYLDRALDATGAKVLLTRIGFKWSVSDALGVLVSWFLYAVVLVATADILGLSQISEFLSAVVLYIPNVIIAVVILLVGIIIANFVQTLVKETASAAGLDAADVLANVAKWAILIFSTMAALIQLGVASELIQILFTGFVFMIALAGGIAFGLGGKDRAKDLLDKLIK